MNFNSNEGFFEKSVIFEKSSKSGLKMPFSGIFLMTYSVLDLGKEQYYQGKMTVKPSNFL